MLTHPLIPAKARAVVYLVYLVIGLILGSLVVGFNAGGLTDPVWLTVALAVYAYLGGAFGFTALTHTPKADATVTPAPEVDHYVPDVDPDLPDPIVDSRGVSWPDRS